MMVAARQYADSNETRAEYRAIRERLYGKPKTANVAVEEKIAIEAYRRKQRIEHEQRMEAEKLWREEMARELMQRRVKRVMETGTSASFVVQNAVDFWSDTALYVPGLRLSLRRSMDRIAREVLVEHPGITMDDIRGDRRIHPIVRARKAIAIAIRKYRPDISSPAIGRFLCKEHTAVLYMIGATKKAKMREAARSAASDK